MPTQLIALLAALLLSWLVFTWLIRVVKTTITTAISIAAIVLVLQVVFGIDPDILWQEILRFARTLQEMFQNVSNEPSRLGK
ncbi:hypothetical protein [Baaleninema simplex]|uniref:hypothetical protein n=1 Tax=Baaleninema simplex TaxID=2862350 RepID=UPI00034C49D5|nr:hypothetical protein [Baaleninema simplex]